MADTTHQEMREGHHRAQVEHMTWLDDIRQWRLDHRRALIQIQALIELHEAELDAAAEAIEDHDHSIMDHEAGGEGEDHESLLTLHNAADERHGKMAEAHEAMKEKHEVFMTAVRNLLESAAH